MERLQICYTRRNAMENYHAEKVAIMRKHLGNIGNRSMRYRIAPVSMIC